MDAGTSTGERIAYWRRQRGLTQQTLAGLVGRSASWMTKVERGVHIVDSTSLLVEIADVLEIDLGYLIGRVRQSRKSGKALDPSENISAIYGALYAGTPRDRQPPHIARLRADVERAGRLTCNGSYGAVAIMLPQLLLDASVAVAQDGDAPDAWWCLAATYHVTSRFARDVGERDLALLTADRACAAAQRSGDDLLLAASARDLTFVLLRKGLLDQAGALCSDAADAIAPRDSTSLAGWSMWGSLRLTQAIILARARDRSGPRHALRDAKAAAERVGPGRNDYWEAFGPANVGAHEVAVALELFDPVKALLLADQVEVEELPVPERRAHFLIDVARAHSLRQHDADTVLVLLEAISHSREDVRYSQKAHDMVRACIKRGKVRASRLRQLAEELGVTS